MLMSIPIGNRGELWGVSSTGWLIITLANSVAHQFYVWLCWRAELHYRWLTRIFGVRAFNVYLLIFVLFLCGRLFLQVVLSWSNRGTLEIQSWIAYTIAVVLCIPLLALVHAQARYFGIQRAAGLDHFAHKQTEMQLVRKGIYRVCPNAQYAFGFLILWIPAILLGSFAGFVAAGFSHAMIWVHYWCTEKPDIRHIYTSCGSSLNSAVVDEGNSRSV